MHLISSNREDKQLEHTKPVSTGALASTRKSAYNPRTVLSATLVATALAAMCCLSFNAGPYPDKFEREHAQVGRVSGQLENITERFDKLGPALGSLIESSLPYEPTPEQIDQLPAPEGLVSFSMNPNALIDPTLDETEQAALNEALSYFSSRGYTCSCLAVDLGTGRVIGSDYDERVYGASTFKAIVAAYVCEELIDRGAYELGGSLQSLIESSVRYSDNNAYRTLKSSYASGLANWASEMGVDPTYVSRYRFPTYSAQESAALWAHIADYLEGEGDTAVWLGEQLSSTNVSEIRDAVVRGLLDGSLRRSLLGIEDAYAPETADANVIDSASADPVASDEQEVDELAQAKSILEHYGASVQNKAGWISGSTNSTSDAGIVHLGGDTYVISIMTSAPDSDESREALTQLALELLRVLR